jgi:hypothetical protein
MISSPRRIAGTLSLALLLSVSSSASLLAQESSSAAPVKQLTTLLDAAKLDSLAAKGPGQDTYVALLYYPGIQLLVVEARYKEPVLLDAKIAKKDYRSVYEDLNSASIPGTKCFVMDLGADGLKPDKEEGRLDTFEDGTTQVQFDGDWKAQKMEEAAYQKAFQEADAKYVRMLEALIAQAKKTS